MKRFFRDNGLSAMMLLLFGLFGVGESLCGLSHHNQEARDHGQATLTYGEYLRSGEHLEATFENWESEFLSVGVLLILSIFLRQRGSPQSKPVHSPHDVNE